MSETPVLRAQSRDRAGKGAARQARRDGLVPGVIYGNNQPPELINLPFNELLKTVNKGGFMMTVFDVDVDGRKTKAIPKDLQVDPVLDLPIHVDLLRVRANATLQVFVPVRFENEDDSPGLVRGGTLNVVRHEVELEVPADAIPEFLTADLTGFDINDTLHISHIPLPANVSPVIKDRDFAIATIIGKGIESAEGEEDQAASESEATE